MIKITYLIIWSTIAILAFNFASANPPISLAENSTDSVYLIFDNPMEQDSFTEQNGRAGVIGSAFLSYIGADGFPVYLDKTGKMVNSLAPRPENQDIKAEIDKYLK